MNRSVEALLPSWRSPASAYLNKQLNVHKKGACIDSIALSGKEFIVFGRKKDNCDIVLDHSSISRVHAVVFFGEMGSVYVMDLGSSHGTCVGEVRLEANAPVLVKPGDEIRFGQSSRIYKLESRPSRPDVPVFGDEGNSSLLSSGVEGTDTSHQGSTAQSRSTSTWTGNAAVQASENSLSTKEQERAERQAQIAAFASEMASSVPVFTSSQSLSATGGVSAALFSRQVRGGGGRGGGCVC